MCKMLSLPKTQLGFPCRQVLTTSQTINIWQPGSETQQSPIVHTAVLTGGNTKKNKSKINKFAWYLCITLPLLWLVLISFIPPFFCSPSHILGYILNFHQWFRNWTKQTFPCRCLLHTSTVWNTYINLFSFSSPYCNCKDVQRAVSILSYACTFCHTTPSEWVWNRGAGGETLAFCAMLRAHRETCVHQAMHNT